MKQTVTLSSFRDAFFRCNRGEQFTYEALELIFDYIEEYECSTGEEIELDPVSICCEWAEDDPKTIAEYYDIDIEGLEDDELIAHVVDELMNATSYAAATSSGSIVYVQF